MLTHMKRKPLHKNSIEESRENRVDYNKGLSVAEISSQSAMASLSNLVKL